MMLTEIKNDPSELQALRGYFFYIKCKIPFDVNVLELSKKNVGINVGINKTEKSVLSLLISNSDMTTDEMATELGLTRRTVERTLVSLRKKGKIERIGSNKSGKWIIDGLPQDYQETTKRLPRDYQDATKTTKEIIKDLLINDPTISVSEIADMIGITSDGVNHHIRKMKKAGEIERVGGDYGGKWKVLK